jgi:hypothetical protein
MWQLISGRVLQRVICESGILIADRPALFPVTPALGTALQLILRPVTDSAPLILKVVSSQVRDWAIHTPMCDEADESVLCLGLRKTFFCGSLYIEL